MDADPDRRIAETLTRLAAARGPDKTFCPSEAARHLFEDWRPRMGDVRRVAAGLCGEGRLRCTRGGRVADPLSAGGPIRLSARPPLRAFFSDRFELPLPPGHRFPMEKYRLLREAIESSDLPMTLAEPPAASDEQLLRVHTPEYLRRVVAGELTPVEVRRIGFPWSPQMVERSRRSTGATLAAARAALADGHGANLAGGTHHAGPERGQGYCVFNDAAVAVRDLQAAGDVARAAVIDLDVHQGNGTAECFAGDDSVVTLSVHGEKNFPARKRAGDIDVALPPGTGDAEYLDALDAALDRLDALGPFDFAVYTSGADPYAADTLGSLALSKPGLLERDRRVLAWLRGRSVPAAVTMAGGYSPDVEDIVDVHLQTLRAVCGP